MKMNIAVFVLSGMLSVTFCLAEGAAAAPAKQSAEATAALKKIQSLMGRPRAASQAEFRKKLQENRIRLLECLADMEKKHPGAAELHEARLHGVMAAVQLGRLTKDPKTGEKALEISRKIVASNAPKKIKLNADAYIILLKLNPVRKPTTAPSRPVEKINADRIILDFVERYAKTDLGPESLLIGISLAGMSDLDSLVTKIEDMLIKRHPRHPLADKIRLQRKNSKVGKPFNATLTKLDGKKLTIPDDLSGKVVVIDFWATWCGPCIREIPHMKSLYAKYKPRGVEFVGVSLDKDRRKLETLVSNRQMGWIHTYSGRGWGDPTARKYGVRGIPSIWVVGKDGNVVSDNARGRLAGTIEKALTAKTIKPAPTTRPAGG